MNNYSKKYFRFSQCPILKSRIYRQNHQKKWLTPIDGGYSSRSEISSEDLNELILCEQIRSILNKLTPDNYYLLLHRLKCIMQTHKSEHNIILCMDEIIHKAMDDLMYHSLLTRMCFDLDPFLLNDSNLSNFSERVFNMSIEEIRNEVCRETDDTQVEIRDQYVHLLSFLVSISNFNKCDRNMMAILSTLMHYLTSRPSALSLVFAFKLFVFVESASNLPKDLKFEWKTLYEKRLKSFCDKNCTDYSIYRDRLTQRMLFLMANYFDKKPTTDSLELSPSPIQSVEAHFLRIPLKKYRAQFNVMLNCLTKDNFDETYDKLQDIKGSRLVMEVFLSVVIQHATRNPFYGDLFARLCCAIRSWQDANVTFNDLLPIHLNSYLDTNFQYFERKTKMASNEENLKVIRLLNLTRFIGSLYKVRLIPASYIVSLAYERTGDGCSLVEIDFVAKLIVLSRSLKKEMDRLVHQNHKTDSNTEELVSKWTQFWDRIKCLAESNEAKNYYKLYKLLRMLSSSELEKVELVEPLSQEEASHVSFTKKAGMLHNWWYYDPISNGLLLVGVYYAEPEEFMIRDEPYPKLLPFYKFYDTYKRYQLENKSDSSEMVVTRLITANIINNIMPLNLELGLKEIMSLPKTPKVVGVVAQTIAMANCRQYKLLSKLVYGLSIEYDKDPRCWRVWFLKPFLTTYQGRFSSLVSQAKKLYSENIMRMEVHGDDALALEVYLFMKFLYSITRLQNWIPSACMYCIHRLMTESNLIVLFHQCIEVWLPKFYRHFLPSAKAPHISKMLYECVDKVKRELLIFNRNFFLEYSMLKFLQRVSLNKFNKNKVDLHQSIPSINDVMTKLNKCDIMGGCTAPVDDDNNIKSDDEDNESNSQSSLDGHDAELIPEIDLILMELNEANTEAIIVQLFPTEKVSQSRLECIIDGVIVKASRNVSSIKLILALLKRLFEHILLNLRNYPSDFQTWFSCSKQILFMRYFKNFFDETVSLMKEEGSTNEEDSTEEASKNPVGSPGSAPSDCKEKSNADFPLMGSLLLLAEAHKLFFVRLSFVLHEADVLMRLLFEKDKFKSHRGYLLSCLCALFLAIENRTAGPLMWNPVLEVVDEGYENPDFLQESSYQEFVPHVANLLNTNPADFEGFPSLKDKYSEFLSFDTKTLLETLYEENKPLDYKVFLRQHFYETFLCIED